MRRSTRRLPAEAGRARGDARSCTGRLLPGRRARRRLRRSRCASTAPLDGVPVRLREAVRSRRCAVAMSTDPELDPHRGRARRRGAAHGTGAARRRRRSAGIAAVVVVARRADVGHARSRTAGAPRGVRPARGARAGKPRRDSGRQSDDPIPGVAGLAHGLARSATDPGVPHPRKLGRAHRSPLADAPEPPRPDGSARCARWSTDDGRGVPPGQRLRPRVPPRLRRRASQIVSVQGAAEPVDDDHLRDRPRGRGRHRRDRCRRAARTPPLLVHDAFYLELSRLPAYRPHSASAAAATAIEHIPQCPAATPACPNP